MRKEEYIDAFNAGSCSPTILLPGLVGSKLVVRIDCPTLLLKNPKLFNTCGWTKCYINNVFDYLRPSSTQLQIPQEEYKIWIPSGLDFFAFFNPLTMTFKTNKRKCIQGILGLKHWHDGDKLVFEDQPGVKILPYGETRKTLKDSDCGIQSVSNMLGKDLLALSTEQFDNFFKNLEFLGYKSGLTMQAIPYDWRRMYQDNGVSEKWDRVIQDMVDLTGKRVSVVAHSMGNLNVYHNLLRMTQEEKDTKINRWFSLAPPFLGAPMALQVPFAVNIFALSPVSLQNILRMTSLLPSIYQLAPKATWKHFKGTKWMKRLENRILHDMVKMNTPKNPEDKKEDSPLDMFPPFEESCGKPFSGRASKRCDLGIREFVEFGSIADKQITIYNIPEMLKGESSYDHAGNLFNEVQDSRFDKLQNPGVQVNILYANHIQSESGFIFRKHTTHASEAEGADELLTAPGDGIVPTTSSVFPGIKWANDFIEQQKSYLFSEKNSTKVYPVNIVEVCGTNRQRDKVEEKENTYIGLECNCSPTLL